MTGPSRRDCRRTACGAGTYNEDFLWCLGRLQIINAFQPGIGIDRALDALSCADPGNTSFIAGDAGTNLIRFMGCQFIGEFRVS